MLVLSRKANEKIIITTDAGQITVTVVKVGPREVRIGIDAPKDMPIVRQELLEGEGDNA